MNKHLDLNETREGFLWATEAEETDAIYGPNPTKNAAPAVMASTNQSPSPRNDRACISIMFIKKLLSLWDEVEYRLDTDGLLRIDQTSP